MILIYLYQDITAQPEFRLGCSLIQSFVVFEPSRWKSDLLSEADLQVGGQVLAWGEGVLPDHHVRDVVNGEAELRESSVQFVQTVKTRRQP